MPNANNGNPSILGQITLFNDDIRLAVAQFKLDLVKLRNANKGPQKAPERRIATRGAVDKLQASIMDAVTAHLGDLEAEEPKPAQAAE